MKKLFLILIATIAFSGSMLAQDYWNPNGYTSHWPDFYDPDYEDQEALVAGIMIDGEIVNVDYATDFEAFEIAAFVEIDGEEQCRGNYMFLYPGYVEEYGDPFPIIDGSAVFYNDAGDGEVYFKMYDHANGILYTDCQITLEGAPITIMTGEEHIEGYWDIEQPIFLNFSTPEYATWTKSITGYGTSNGGYYIVSSPVQNSFMPDADNGFITGTYDLFYFDQFEDEEWRNFKANEFEIVSGTGYLYASQDDTELAFTGYVYNDRGKVDLVYNDENPDIFSKGWNLIGNPFPVEAFVNGGRQYYVVNPEADAGDPFIPGIASDGIPSMEGILVHATEEGESVVFGTEYVAKSSLLSLNLLGGNGLVDRAVVNFDGQQLPKFQLNSSSTKLYIPMDDRDYAVVSCGEMGELPVNFEAETSGSYTLAVSAEEVGFNYLHLIDNMTGADVDLLATPSYSFEASVADYASRFRLVFATGNSDDSFAFYSNGSFVVSNEGEATVQVLDVTGRMLSSETINGSANIRVDEAAGVYMIRLVNGENVKVQKVVVR